MNPNYKRIEAFKYIMFILISLKVLQGVAVSGKWKASRRYHLCIQHLSIDHLMFVFLVMNLEMKRKKPEIKMI